MERYGIKFPARTLGQSPLRFGLYLERQKMLNSIHGLLRRLAALLCMVILMCAPSALAQLKVDITKGNIDPMPIAIPDFSGGDPEITALGRDISEVVRNDLARSGLFKALDPASFISGQLDISYQPIFADWRVIKAEALVVGQIVRVSNSQLRVEFRLWDVFKGQQMTGLSFSTTPENWRRVSHKVSDAIYQQLTGEAGYFDSRIAYIDETGPKLNRKKRLAIMDQDGANKSLLETGSNTVLTPGFSPNGEKIAYLSYEALIPHVYMFDLASGQRELLGDFPGMTFAPNFSPKGDKVIMTLSRRGNSDIYSMDLATRSTSRLTSDPAIDVSASYSPTGRKIVFNSDRGGSPQLYTMKSDGSSVKRISFGKGRYSAPVWSPRGDLIAFVKSNKGEFSIGVMKPDGSGERNLTTSFLDESPVWSPNGRVILFSRETRGTSGKSQVWSVDLTGRNLQKLPTRGAASDPAWSPVLP